MKAELQAAAGMLSSLGVNRYLVAVTPETLPPYVVLAPLTPSALPDDRLDALQVAVDEDVRVTAVAGTPEGALDLLLRARTVLSPSGGPSFPTVTGRTVQLTWLRFEVADVDTSVTIPTTNRNPAYAVDTYALLSQPTT